MPELPEVETTKRGIEPHLKGHKIISMVIRQPKLRWPIPTNLPDLVKGLTVLSLSRRGKYIGLHTEKGTIIVHLGMSGSLYFVGEGTPPLFHDHVDFQLSNGKWLRYTDPRRFGAILWHDASSEEKNASIKDSWQQHTLLASLGPEPLTMDFNANYLFLKAKNKKQAIKTFIMDSKQVVGVGNIYANEALFLSGIHPHKAAGTINAEQFTVLVDCIKKVLSKAIEQGGTTLKDFVGGDGKPGYFKQSLNVYGRAGDPCVTCSSILEESRLGQRSTVFCNSCQK
ncbi:bifunctional DNA-formamidopyrimidine glycosylase/DNA-(apurinic or apyrimidinic site) lyase [Marinomonas agarivorans]|nr:bifunctional DNA-formamidopyrimidine glycosylase/DNA-(apurinic or apyrimidinic site) lyase [Marinomonas agarivorans]